MVFVMQMTLVINNHNQNHNHAWTHKHDELSQKNQNISIFLQLRHLYVPFMILTSENQIAGVGSRSGRIHQSQCTFPRFVIDLVLPLLLSTPTIWFSLDHKRNVGGGVVSGVGRNGDFVILPIPWLVTARTIPIFVTRSRKQ